MTITHPGSTFSVPAAKSGGCPFDPPPAYQRARDEQPVTRVTLWDGSQCWLVTRHQDIREALRDRRLSSEADRPGFPFITPNRRALASDRRGNTSFIRMDDPEHARLRKMLTPDFMIKKTETLRPRIQEIVDDFLDRMIAKGAPADLVADFALPIPSLVICLLLGVDYADHEFFQERSRIMLHNNTTPEQVAEARDDLLDYLGDLAAAKRARPDDSIIGKLAARPELSHDEVASMGLLLLIAGHETTANMTALGTLALLRNPGQLAALRDDPALAPSAVEELLRYLTIVQSGVARVAKDDLEIGGETVRAGEGVLFMISAANRDPEAFPWGDDLDITQDARRHLAFGFGVHQCLGQPLARVELQVALATLVRRLPGLRLAIPFEDVRFRTDMAIYGVHELPVAW
ncbi:MULTISPECIES: cytochrome P450 [Streptomycetaceae]|uniref:Cytochrome P450 monooxygenase CYP105B2 n=1 Tax=Streptantibioticus cattleyicolor (strain ATCC 35852 / DSM 46488 / JCM 4925 / NBRC 14057 / NRRL 8057) TaxID=1003195 RepID=F8JNV6_STREN|nr:MULTISPECIES: cytochrome P450 [Streptomycetaceae]AEW92688.1 cytochrome P450 monooxygenase CYP105B2 [Streptantibioticus cattleyicolor NRRL 8057 = DSM 46488]MYS57458.1 cytochrome P450 [Streptomyces sp. SID5468]CCB73045.1 Cytochrome P450-SU2 [Streptantibioticus cattleyicolor NRRL 8057 = DSM 46488]